MLRGITRVVALKQVWDWWRSRRARRAGRRYWATGTRSVSRHARPFPRRP